MGGALVDRPPIWNSKHRKKNWMLFNQKIPLLCMALPGLVFIAIFNYYPMLGLQVAFKEFNYAGGIWSSPWNNFANFDFLNSSDFWMSVRNTFTLTFSRLIIGFPLPIILALLFNELRNEKYKKIVQTISYMPHFVSWVVVFGIMQALMNQDNGVFNQVLVMLGGEPYNFLARPQPFIWLFLGSGIWKEIGFGTIIYLATIASINPEMYEAAVVDGASKWAQIRYITLPSMMPTISILLILSVPGLLSAGYDQIYPMLNDGNREAAEVIDTFIIRMGLNNGMYGFATAIGIVMSVLTTTLVVVTNFIAGKTGGETLF